MSEARQEYDVIILGGGVAGTSAGITLLQREGIKVAVAERSNYQAHRVGESLSPGARPLLEYLKVWDRFQREQPMDSYGSLGAWTSPEPEAFDFLYTLHGSGWSLDRNRFDLMLKDTFIERGGAFLSGSSFVKAEEIPGEGWEITLKNETGELQLFKTGYVIDATGRQGVFAKHIGQTRIVHDKLVGVCCLGKVPKGNTVTSQVMVEACEYGWWYSAPIAGNKMVVVLMSDADIVNQLEAKNFDAWKALLNAMPLTAQRVSEITFEPSTSLYPAFSSVLSECGGTHWLAVGDAAVSHDPLSSSGIPHAMGSGVQGAIVALDSLYNAGEARKAYQEGIQNDFHQYCKTHWQYYSQVKRWPDSVFWKRRTTAIRLNPNAVLQGRKLSGKAMDLVHLPGRPAQGLMDLCEQGKAVHEIVRAFHSVYPQYPDQQVILGFQEMVEKDLVQLAE